MIHRQAVSDGVRLTGALSDHTVTASAPLSAGKALPTQQADRAATAAALSFAGKLLPTQRAAGLRSVLIGAGALGLAVCLFCFPETVFRSLLQGFETAFCHVVPAVFPLMVISGVIMDTALSAWLGLFLYPFTRALGIRERSAATVLLLGLLGGFAVLAQGVDQLYRSRRIDRRQAELLLCAGMNAGPSFILLSVGHSIFGSIGLGALLLCAVYLGNLGAALLLKLFGSRPHDEFCGQLPAAMQQPRTGSFTFAMQRAVSACTALCGYIAFFRLLCALLQQLLPAAVAGCLCTLLEVTNGVVYASGRSGAARLWLTVLALSWSGFSIHLQAKALLSPEISLKRFYLSRIPAVPLSLTLYGIGIRLFPQILPAMAAAPVRGSRFSGGIVLTLFWMVGAFLYECTPKSTLRGRKKVL